MQGRDTIGEALAAAIAHVRSAVGDATASIAVITPSRVNANLARRELAFTGPFIRVAFVTPAQLHAELAEGALRAQGLQTEPPGWLGCRLRRLLAERDDLGAYGEAMRDAGWLPSLTAALGTIENALITAGDLRSLERDAADEDTRRRASLLAALLEAVDVARAEERLASPRETANAARHAAVERAHLPANVHRGCVLLGDARNTRATYETLQAYLHDRPVARVDLPHVRELAPAMLGITAAAPHAESFVVSDHAPELTLVRTPDPMREVVEAVREVQRAIEEGVPYDRIALVLPDPAEAVTLREALERAGIPATWQTGPALALAPAARFLLHALSLRAGEDTVRAWYELLRLPSLKLRANAGEAVSRGRARWRRLLARCGAFRGTDTILAALDAYQEELADETEDPERLQKDAEGFDSLRGAMRRVLHDLPSHEPKRLGTWSSELREFLTRWWPQTRDQRAVVRLLDAWGGGTAGPEVGAREAFETFTEALEATIHLRGSLKDPSIRVLSPMQLVGGRFERVYVTGLTQGRFPADPSADPILTDALVDALPREAGLFRSDDRVALERRRFASIRSAATERLWCSVPKLDLTGGRPQLPGALIMALASERGERLSFAQLEARLQPRGRRSRPYPVDATTALGPAEHLLARLHIAEERDAAISALVDHPWSRRLLRMHRAIDRIADGGREAELRPFGGFVTATPCVGLDGSPLSPRELAQLVGNPLEFLFRKMLSAYSAPRLHDAWAPDRAAEWLMVEVVEDVLKRPTDLSSRLQEGFATGFADRAQRAGYDDEVTLQRTREQVSADLASFADQGPSAGAVVELDSLPVALELPWTVSGGVARRVGSGLQWVELDRRKVPAPGSKKRPPATIFEASAHALSGAEVSEMQWVGIGKRVSGDLEKHGSSAMEDLHVVTDLVRGGFFGTSAPAAARLETDGGWKQAEAQQEWESWQ